MIKKKASLWPIFLLVGIGASIVTWPKATLLFLACLTYIVVA